MILNHVGIINGNPEQAELFYKDFLKFEKTREFILSPELSGQLFDLSREISVLVFERDGIKLEVFICPECRLPTPDLGHIGLYLDDLSTIVEQARVAGVQHIIGKTGEKTVHFIRDFYGNLIEIKQK
jgi:catechol 2,3-dioxygenase-like lactoylglutathione lyase family enzyme